MWLTIKNLIAISAAAVPDNNLWVLVWMYQHVSFLTTNFFKDLRVLTFVK